MADLLRKLNLKTLGLDLLFLYVGKSGSVVVGIFVLPLYQKIMGPSSFGVVALLLSIQAFLLMVDLGASTVVGRNLAANSDRLISARTMFAAQMNLHIFYILLLGGFILLSFAGVLSFSLIDGFLAVAFFWAITVQNVSQSALLAMRKYALAGGLQAAGILFRSIATLVCLLYISSDVRTFLVLQAVTAVLHMLVTDRVCYWLLGGVQALANKSEIVNSMRKVFKQGFPLILFGLSGALVMQADKVIISSYNAPSELSPYYLATVLCLTPISVLAAPVSQYFHPKIVHAVASSDGYRLSRNVKIMVMALMAVVVVPSCILWMYSQEIVGLWLLGQDNAGVVSRYVGILLPGVAIGAFGFIPYSILVANEDYKFQAFMSVTLTILTLAAALYFSFVGSVAGVCYVYAVYHAFSFVVSWLRVKFL